MSDSLLNKTALRKYTFEALARVRPGLVGKMTRVGDDFFVKMEARLRSRIINDGKEANGGELKTLRPTEPVNRPEDMEWLLNQSNVREYALRTMALTCPDLTQISGDYAASLDIFLRRAIDGYLDAMSSAGKTIS